MPVEATPSPAHRVRTKICGVTTVADARAAVAAGADAIGLVFAERSSRAITLATARDISRAIGPFVSRVGLFMDTPAATVSAAVAAVDLDMLQFHGAESSNACRGFGKPYLKAVAMGDGADRLADAAREYPDAAGLLLDGHRAGETGGRGETFDWQASPEAIAQPIILAGGLNADNVGVAIRTVRPYAVDVSSGAEIRRGVKSIDKMQAFVSAVLNAGTT